MPWWNEVIALVKEELKPGVPEAGPEALGEASQLLTRTAREIAQAQAMAEAARRRLLRAQGQLEVLTRTTRADSRYHERLVELARVVAHESELIESFDRHIASLKQLGDNIQAQIRRLQHDADMVFSAQAAKRTANAAPERARRQVPVSEPKSKLNTEPGFRNQRPGQALDALKTVPIDPARGKRRK